MSPSTPLGTLRGAVAAWTTVPAAKLKTLGRVASFDYAVYKDVEYAITARPVTPEEIAPGPGEILVTAEVQEVIDGQTWGSTAHFRGWPVPSGTFDRESARRRRRKPAQRAPHPQDALDLPGLRRREPVRLTLDRPSSEVTVGALKARVGAKVPAVAEVGGQEGIDHTPAGYIAWLRSRGVELEAARGHLLARTTKPLDTETRILLSRAEALLVAHLSGEAMICVLCDRAAVSIGFPSAPLCAEHLGADR